MFNALIRWSLTNRLAFVWVEFEWGADIDHTRQTITQRLTVVTDRRPSQVEPPTLTPMLSIMSEILFISLTSDRHSNPPLI